MVQLAATRVDSAYVRGADNPLRAAALCTDDRLAPTLLGVHVDLGRMHTLTALLYSQPSDSTL
jgi:hypothetical protein